MIGGQIDNVYILHMLYIYQALIKSFLDYGCLVYGSAAKSALQRLDRIQSKALRLCGVPSGPVEVLQVDSVELPLRIFLM